MRASSFFSDIVRAALAVTAAILLDAVFDNRMFSDSILRLCSLGLFAASLNILVGYTGLLSFGQATFFGAGAYMFTLLMQGGSVNIPAAFLLTLLGSCTLALAIGSICVRLSGVYFTFLTLAVQMMAYSMLIAWSSVTGGEQGLTGGLPLPSFWGIDLTQRTPFFVFNLVVFAAGLLIMHWIVRSSFGAAMRLIRDNPERAVFLGVPVRRYKLAAFFISSMFATAAGVLMSLFVSGAFPNFAYWSMSGEGLFMIMLGGVTSFLGPVVGAALLILLEALVNAYSNRHGLVIGIVILISVLGLRRGVLDYLTELLAARRQKSTAGNAVVHRDRVTDPSTVGEVSPASK